MIALLLVPVSLHARAQVQIGTVEGVVLDADGAVVPDVAVRLGEPLTGARYMTRSDSGGRFVFNNVPFGSYVLDVDAAGFRAPAFEVHVRSNLPNTIEVSLDVAETSESITVAGKMALVDGDSASSETRIDRSLIRRAPGAALSRQLASVIATTPGWTTQNNGLLHIRGVDDGILYVIDGIPVVDRLDAVSGSSFDADMVRSMSVFTGLIPAEFGGRSGAVVSIQPRSGIDLPLTGSLSVGAASFSARELEASLGGALHRKFGFFVSGSAGRSNRFLDPVDIRNFNNRGGTAKLNLKVDWHPTAFDLILVTGASNGSDFRVPNRLIQEQAGQRQRQELRDNAQSLRWERIWSVGTVSNLAYFRHSFRSRLHPSPFDTPVLAEQDRRHTRQGVLGSVTHLARDHTFKAGFEMSGVTPRESFRFIITDPEEAEKQEISDPALEFTDHPFVFEARRTRRQVSLFFQDEFSPWPNLRVNAGVRFDYSTLPVSEHQFSPRIGAVYYFPRTGTALRGSFHRLFMPPQIENLLLADSPEARSLSPFVSEGKVGGAAIAPERVSAYELGFAQDAGGRLRLDVAYWWRNFRNFDDPNVFFNTTLILPNSVAEGFARGTDVRIDIPDHKGWSAYLSYTNARILQTGPITGGLFLTDEFIEIGEGTRFIPDHDQRNVGSAGLTYYNDATGLWASLSGRHESGVPLEVEDDRLEDLVSEPGADLVNFQRQRVKPWTVVNLSIGVDLFEDEKVSINAQFDIQNVADRRFAYNFGSPFEGTHFGHPRLWSGRLKFIFR